MKLTVIGYWGGFPAADGATSAYLLEKNNFSLLIDIGSASLSKLQKYVYVSDLDAVIVSHYHHDHVADLGVLQYARLVEYYVTGYDTVLPIYGHKEDEEAFNSLSHTYTKGIAYNPEDTLQIGPFSISFLKTKHPVPCYGMRITDGYANIVYTADTGYQKDWEVFAKDVDLLIADCNYYQGQDGTAAGHMNSEEVGKIAQNAKVKQLLLSHLPQYGDQKKLIDEVRQYYKGDIHLAKEGLIWHSKVK